MESTLQLLLHPVRWGIVQRLAAGPATPAALQEAMVATAPATLYRQLQSLQEAGLVEVVDEKKVRGAVERTYGLAGILAGPDPTPEGRRNQALLVLNLLQHDVLACLVDGAGQQDRVGTTRTRIHATPQELEQLQARLTELVTPLLEPHEGSSPLSLGLVMVPLAE
ncbi:helix-turn-helix domain-containing protein [Luteococcus peritonei]|uniref:Helix-turn-helix domain-containing protein n=1 Tax=Luteococcus peritonei TaxID=88874 RepID=A0ABW4RXW3_9ACTN